MGHAFSPIRPGLFALGLAAIAAPLAAQTPPDAGALRQQIEQQREASQQGPMARPEGAEPAALVAPSSGIQIQTRAFRFVGNTLLDAVRLQGAVEGFLNRPLDYSQLQGAVTAVMELYKRSGWVVRAFLPEQEIADGVVSIQVEEAVFGGTRMEERSALRVSPEQIQNLIDAHQPVGQMLNADALDRALLLVDDLPGVAASGDLMAGALPGQTQLMLRLNSKPLVQGEATLDNAGSRSTGPLRLSLNMGLHSPFHRGEQLNAELLETEGSDYVNLAASLPVASYGWRVGVNASSLHYKLLLSTFAALDARGSSDSLGLEANYPLIRSRLHNLYLSTKLDQRTYDNLTGSSTSSHYRSNNLSLGLWGNSFDRVLGGSTSASLTWTGGQLDLAGSPHQAGDAASTRTEGFFNKLRYSVIRQQPLQNDLLLYASLSGQWADRNLDSSEKFYLGGANGVRAYPSNEAGGASGQLLNLELRQRLPQGFNLSAFFDAGLVTTYFDNRFRSAPAINQTLLQGYGLGLAWRHRSGLNLQAVWAHRLGTHPNPAVGGNDQDGSLLLDRWWLTASLPF